VLAELLPRVVHLAQLARGYGIGLNIDAEEADRLELSLDIFARLAAEPSLVDWPGMGFVVQAYQKRARAVIDWLVTLARANHRRFMVRLVKGAYWDTEIKRAQVDGLSDYPVFTRKVHTDVSYLACARAMLAAPDALYPQFATHNAFTIAAVHAMAGDTQFEFQCLHGMGESVYDQVVAAAVHGQGVALGRMSLLQQDLRDKRLVTPFGKSQRIARAFHVVYAAEAESRPEARQFVEWIQQQLKREG
jgi:RHH-type proline utilization regulon transcriptional repressor/proline dehydrogenase/delta 1-pyrroline-5-carboxylate dehydrogenase